MKELENLFILIAEDDLDDAAIIQRSFKKHPSFSKVQVVSNGEALWDHLRSWDAQKPNVILSDINMPKVSGIELLKMVFDDSKLCSIPFFVYSSSGNVIYEKKCSDLGAKGFFVKPFDLMEFDNIPAQILLALKKDLQIHPNDAPAF